VGGCVPPETNTNNQLALGKVWSFQNKTGEKKTARDQKKKKKTPGWQGTRVDIGENPNPYVAGIAVKRIDNEGHRKPITIKDVEGKQNESGKTQRNTRKGEKAPQKGIEAGKGPSKH